MYFDSYSQIGSSHTENEDFAVIGDKENPFIIVCDGCSGSKNTSVGSKILALSTAEILKTNISNKLQAVGIYAIWKAHTIIRMLGLDSSSLDATLLIAVINDDEVKVCMWGDGYLYSRYYGEDSISSIAYSNEMPYYLSYRLNNKRDLVYDNLVKSGGIQKTIHNNDRNSLSNPLTPVTYTFTLSKLDYLLLSTDGASSFIESNNLLVQQTNINSQIIDFKRLNGEFIGRRIKRMMKLNSKEGIKHLDDLTIAGISFTD